VTLPLGKSIDAALHGSHAANTIMIPDNDPGQR